MIDLMEEEEKSRLPAGWRVKEMDQGALDKHLSDVKSIAAQLAAIPRIKKERPDLSHLTEKERQEYYFNEQPESTKQAILRQRERKPDDDNDYLLRPIPEGAVANPEAKSLDELTAKRQLGIEETLLVEDIRRKGRNTIGQSTAGSVSPERRESGIHAFTYSKPANPSDAEIKRLKKLKKLEAVVTAEAQSPQKPKRPWWKFWQKEEGEGSAESDWSHLLRTMDERRKK